jgi:manganese efflux pump family protein
VNLFEIALVSVALALNTSGICFAAGYSMRKSDSGIMLRFLLILVITQIIFSFSGLFLGAAICGLFPAAILWITLLVLIVMGLKIVYESMQAKPEDWTFDTTEIKVVIRLALAASIDPLIVFTGIGLLLPNLPNTILVVGVTFLLFCSGWIMIGRMKGAPSIKLRIRSFGGLILLAAGLHLLIKLIR